MDPQSIHSTIKRQFPERNKASNDTFRTRDLFIIVLCVLGILSALFFTSSTAFVPLLKLRSLENVFRNEFQTPPVDIAPESIQEIAGTMDTPSWSKIPKLATSDSFLCFYDTRHFVLLSKESLDSWGEYRSYFTNSFDSPFFRWIQEQFPHGYTTFRAHLEGSEASKIHGSTARISSVALSDTHLFILYENWGAELYSISTSKDAFHLSLLWYKSILRPVDQSRGKDEPVEYFVWKPSEVTIQFLNHAVHDGDQGLIVIGARSNSKVEKLGRVEALARANEFDENKVIYTYISNDNREGNYDTKPHGATKDIHYSYFGVELHSGEIRWRHENDDFRYSHKETLHPQHNFRVDSDQEESHTGEVHWRNYVEDMLAKGTPHLHRHDDDTIMVPAHFKPSSKRISEKPTQPNDRGLIGNKLNKFISTVGSPTRKGMDSKSQYTDEIPNVLIVHLGVGVEVIHIYSGRTLCQLTPLKKNVAYGDLNADGSLNSAQVVTQSRGFSRGSDTNCVAEIESGNKGNSEVVFRTPVCTMQQTWRKASLLHLLNEKFDPQDTSSLTMGVAPVILKRFNYIRNKIEHDVIFLASSGLITCITNDNGKWKVKWQVESASSWSPSDSDLSTSLGSGAFFPHITLYRINEGSFDKNILAVGKDVLTVLDLGGNIVQTIPLPSPVIAPVKLLDADLDGNMDIQIETMQGVLLYSSKQNPGSSRIIFILLSLIVILGIMFLSANLKIENPLLQGRQN